MANPRFSAYGRYQLEWIEKGEYPHQGARLDDANNYINAYRALRGTVGYYCDSFYDAIAVPALYVVSTVCDDCAGEGCDECDEGETHAYYSAVRDPHNSDGAIVDFSEAYDDAEDAARDAHNLAERYTEAAREEDAKFQAEQQIEYALASVKDARIEHSALIRERTTLVPESMTKSVALRHCSALRAEVTKLAERVRKLRENFWESVQE